MTIKPQVKGGVGVGVIFSRDFSEMTLLSKNDARRIFSNQK